jgi:hypothetical protein
MATGEPVVYMDFTGGIHLDESTYLIADKECYDARNVTTKQHGELTKRDGWARHSTMGVLDKAHTLFPLNIGANTNLLAIGPDGSEDKAVHLNGSGASTTLTLNSPLTTLTANKRWSFAQGPKGTNGTATVVDATFYGINGVDRPMRWTGNSSDPMNEWEAWAGQTVPRYAKYLIYHLDQFWASGDPNFPGRVYRTGTQNESFFTTPLPDPCNWDTAFIDDVEPFDGQNITGLGKVGPYLLVFKAQSTYVLSDPNTGVYRKISSTMGCSSHRSIVETAEGTMFYSDDVGVCITDGTNIRVLSTKIEPLLDAVASAYPLATKNSVATFWKDSYYLSFPGLGQSGPGINTLTLEYKTDTQAWWIHTCAADDFAILDPSGTPRLYGVDPVLPLAQRCFVQGLYSDSDYVVATPTTDVRKPYQSIWQGPYWTWGNPHLNKRVAQFRMDGLGNWTARAAERFQQNYRPMDSVLWEQGPASATSTIFGGAGTFGPAAPDGEIFGVPYGVTQMRYPTPLDGWGRAWSIKIEDGESTNPFELYSIAAFIRPRKD